jgi:hypothetical protein
LRVINLPSSLKPLYASVFLQKGVCPLHDNADFISIYFIVLVPHLSSPKAL